MLAHTERISSSAPLDPAIIRVLVVDDNPFFRASLISWIARHPNIASCGYADSPLTALQSIARHSPDIVLLDLQLRDGTGFDLLLVLQAAKHQPRVIVLSQQDENIFAERSIRAGARGYVHKDEAMDVMLVAIHEVLRGGLHLSAELRRRLPASPIRTGS